MPGAEHGPRSVCGVQCVELRGEGGLGTEMRGLRYCAGTTRVTETAGLRYCAVLRRQGYVTIRCLSTVAHAIQVPFLPVNIDVELAAQ
eukprot:2600696-Rhodomonas_salina.1